ncbi:Similar to APN1: Aminopeptidase N (Plutella xylostella) [Cotesia congregata]|uniref:Similar to APN1: Aminopeptidase N (Plutella xylostella) n=1 Tax=Cotesia congregata TaxID=51543 RepID=A0A8J2MQG2_COTCN|nr:Similar to APN1: Aminopeptidase N (Plutella xylostella) [Cotesia congregata]
MESEEKLYRTIAEIIINQAFDKYDTIQSLKNRNLEMNLKKYLVSYVTDKITGQQNFVSLYVLKQRMRIFQDMFINNRLRDKNIDISFSPTVGFRARMIAHIVGEEKVVLLIEDNLRNRDKIRNTDLLSELLEISGKKSFLEGVIEDWRRKGGLPVVTIERNYQSNSAIIKQIPFTQSTNKTSSKQFWIPLYIATQRNADFDSTSVTKWFDSELESIEIVTPPPDQWVICNKQQFGYYRVNYDERNWKLITNYLKSENYKKIHVLNRAQLIDDAFVFAEFGYLNFNVAFDLARYLKVETEYVPWATFWEKMFRLYQYSSISGSQYYEPFKNMILELSGPLERKFLSDAAFDGNNRLERLNKIAGLASTVQRYAETIHLINSKIGSRIPLKIRQLLEDLRKEILCAGSRSADKKTWEKLLEKYLIDKDNTILYALMCSSNYELLHELIMLFINGQLVQSNPWYFLIKIVEQSTIGLDTIIHFIDNKQAVIHRMYHHYSVDPSTGFITNHGAVTYDMKHFHDFVDSFYTVIEQFITNKQQRDKFKKILNDNFDTLGSIEAADHLYFAQMKVNNSTSVFNLMKAYWETEEKLFDP